MEKIVSYFGKFNGLLFLMIEEFDGSFLLTAFLIERDCVYVGLINPIVPYLNQRSRLCSSHKLVPANIFHIPTALKRDKKDPRFLSIVGQNGPNEVDMEARTAKPFITDETMPARS